MEPRFGYFVPADQRKLLFILLSSFPEEIFEQGFNEIKNAFGSQQDGALIDRNTREKNLNEKYFLGWVQPSSSPSANLALNFINKRKPGGEFRGRSEDGHPKIFEIVPLGVPIDAKDYVDVCQVSRIAVPAKNLALVIVDKTARSTLIHLKLPFEQPC